MKAHLKFFVSRRLTRDMDVILEKGSILWITVDNLWYNNFLNLMPVIVYEDLQFFSKPSGPSAF